MNYEVKISEDKTFVWHLPHENITMQLAYEMSQDAIRLARENNIYRFLSDVRGIRNTDSLLKNFDFAYVDIEKLGYLKSDKIAIVHDADDHSHDFIKQVSLNQGYNVKLFTTIQEAIDWLSA